MTITFHGFLPTAGETSRILDHSASFSTGAIAGSGAAQHEGSLRRAATLDYLGQCAGAAEYMGCDSVLVQISPYAENEWITAAALMARTDRLKYLVALRPSVIAPAYAAQMISTFQRFSGNRIYLNITPGVAGPTFRRFGVWLSKSELLEQAGEFLTILRGVWSGEPFDFEGRYFHVEGAADVAPEVIPRVFYAGSSEESMRFAAEYADVYLSMIEPIDMVAERLQKVQKMAADLGRHVVSAMSFNIIARETSEEAWAVAHASMQGATPEILQRSAEITKAKGVLSATRTRLLSRLGESDDSVVGPNLFVGRMRLQTGVLPDLVGSYEEIADRIAELAEAGCEEFQVGSTPNLEESYRLAENLMPILRARGLLAQSTTEGAG